MKRSSRERLTTRPCSKTETLCKSCSLWAAEAAETERIRMDTENPVQKSEDGQEYPAVGWAESQITVDLKFE